MAVKITGISPGSIAERHGIAEGSLLLGINGHSVADVLDYRFYAAEENLLLSLEAPSGERYEKRLRKEEYGDIGLEFETYLMDSQRSCRNKCVFCFIDQLPKGMRESLYFKDDDSRLGFLFGNYVTLTNLSDSDIDRIITMRTSPVNISAHTMNPNLRNKMMGNPRAGSTLRHIKRLTDAGIKVNAQLVLCPGINDGAELEYSLRELSALAPNLESVAAVPVGLTKFREGLAELEPYGADTAKNVILTVQSFASENLRKHGSPVCHAADEFYLMAGMDFPDYEYYGEFSQLENGVGLLPLLRHEFALALEAEPARPISESSTIATGVAAAPAIKQLAGMAMEKFPGLSIRVIAVENEFFGSSVTVAGLVTGGDLIARLKREKISGKLLIPAVMLRHERDLFLDGVSLADVENALGVTVRAVENDGFELLGAILGQRDAAPTGHGGQCSL